MPSKLPLQKKLDALGTEQMSSIKEKQICPPSIQLNTTVGDVNIGNGKVIKNKFFLNCTNLQYLLCTIPLNISQKTQPESGDEMNNRSSPRSLHTQIFLQSDSLKTFSQLFYLDFFVFAEHQNSNKTLIHSSNFRLKHLQRCHAQLWVVDKIR